jgi:hypothetical protein
MEDCLELPRGFLSSYPVPADEAGGFVRGVKDFFAKILG